MIPNAVFHGVTAPTWASDEGLAWVLRAEADQADTKRDRALLLHAADRLDCLTRERDEALEAIERVRGLLDGRDNDEHIYVGDVWRALLRAALDGEGQGGETP